MAPVFCFVTSGDTHHEEAYQGCSGNCYFSGFLLLDHHRNEHWIRRCWPFEATRRFGSNHDPCHAVGTPAATPVHGLGPARYGPAHG